MKSKAADEGSKSAMSSLTGSDYSTIDDDLTDPTVASSASLQLCGRNTQVLSLLKAYQRVRQEAQVVVVHGESGFGKSTLVDSLRTPVFDSHGFFCSGKYFQNDGGVQDPYSAVMAAFSDLCDLMSQSSHIDKDRRDEIRETLGMDRSVLQTAIPNLSSFLSKDCSDESQQTAGNNSSSTTAHPNIKIEAVFAKFKIACRRFLRAMSSPEHPVVVFLDDIQWMDEGSKEVIVTLLNDNELKNVLLVVAYRDEEAEKVADTLQDMNRTMVDIPLQSLDTRAVHMMVSEDLGYSSKDTHELAELIHKRTRGNPFYVHQLLSSLQFEGLLVNVDGSWTFDLKEIREKGQVADDIADVLTTKVRNLPGQVQQALKLASLIGYSFQECILDEVLKSVQSEVNSVYNTNLSSCLKKSADDGFVEQLSTSSYQFCHDKVQTAFQTLILDSERESLHKMVGEVFLRLDTPEGVYNGTYHLNQAQSLIVGENEQVQMVRRNLEASEYCKARSAYIQAAEHLRCGLALLDKSPNKWTEHFSLSFEITESLARMEIICGNLKKSDELIDTLLSYATNVDMKLISFELKAESLSAQGDLVNMLEYCKRFIQLVGIKIPSKFSVLHLLLKIMQVRSKVRGKTDQDFLELPQMENERFITGLKLLFYAGCACQPAGLLLESVYYSHVATEMSIKHGLAPYSGPAFVGFGLTQLNSERSYRFSNLGMKIVDKLHAKEVECVTSACAYCYATHSKHPLDEIVMLSDKSMILGFDIGDVVFGVWSLFTSAIARTMTGQHLAEVDKFMYKHYRRAQEMNQTDMLRWLDPVAQSVVNLQTHPTSWKEVTALNGEMMTEKTFIEYAEKKKQKAVLFFTAAMKLQLAFHFGAYTMAETLLEDLDKNGGRAQHKHIFAPAWFFYGSSVYFQRFKRGRYKQDRRRARKYMRMLRGLLPSPTAAIYMKLLEAEACACKQNVKKEEVVAAYRKAIEVVSEAGWNHMEGVANERLACYLADCEDFDGGKFHFTQALHLYRDKWGAHAKADWLEEKQSKVFSPNRESHQARSIPGNIVRLVPPLESISE